MRPVHVVDHDQVELVLTGCLAPIDGFTPELPLIVPPTVAVGSGSRLELHDVEVVPLAYAEVDGPPPAVTGRLATIWLPENDGKAAALAKYGTVQPRPFSTPSLAS